MMFFALPLEGETFEILVDISEDLGFIPREWEHH
jgi:hypothetical protein